MAKDQKKILIRKNICKKFAYFQADDNIPRMHSLKERNKKTKTRINRKRNRNVIELKALISRIRTLQMFQ